MKPRRTTLFASFSGKRRHKLQKEFFCEAEQRFLGKEIRSSTVIFFFFRKKKQKALFCFAEDIGAWGLAPKSRKKEEQRTKVNDELYRYF
jgi:hypothetical protein